MNKQRLVMLIVAGLGMLATFLPWVNVPIIGSVSGTAGDGWITFVLFLVALIFCLLNNKSKPLTGGFLAGAIVPCLLAAIFGIWKIIDFNAELSAVMGDDIFSQAVGSSVSIGFGLYLVVIAGFVLPIAAFLIKDKEQ